MTFVRRVRLFLVFVLAVAAFPVVAQGDPMGSVASFFSDIEGLMQQVATSAAIIGFLGLALMNFGSSLPVVADWKQEHPKATRDVMFGLVILLFVGGGGLVGMLSF
jgi:hypothetical protein